MYEYNDPQKGFTPAMIYAGGMAFFFISMIVAMTGVFDWWVDIVYSNLFLGIFTIWSVPGLIVMIIAQSYFD